MEKCQIFLLGSCCRDNRHISFLSYTICIFGHLLSPSRTLPLASKTNRFAQSSIPISLLIFHLVPILSLRRVGVDFVQLLRFVPGSLRSAGGVSGGQTFGRGAVAYARRSFWQSHLFHPRKGFLMQNGTQKALNMKRNTIKTQSKKCYMFW